MCRPGRWPWALAGVEATLGRPRANAKNAAPATRQGIGRDPVRGVTLTAGKWRGRKEPPRVDVEYAFDATADGYPSAPADTPSLRSRA